MEQNTANKGFWYIKNITDFMPIAQVIILVFTAIAGLVKYYNTKNREIYEKRLKEVYAPLYKRLVKQEYFRKMTCENIKNASIEEAPILTITHEIKKSTLSDNKWQDQSFKENFVDRKIFVDIMNGVNAGLASGKLVTLIALYESSIYMENVFNKDTDNYFKNAILQHKIELNLYDEIINGYQECYKKLKLDKKLKSTNWHIDNNKLYIDYNVNNDELNSFKIKYKENHENYN